MTLAIVLTVCMLLAGCQSLTSVGMTFDYLRCGHLECEAR